MPLLEGFEHSRNGMDRRSSTPLQATLLFDCMIGRDRYVKVYGEVHEDELVFCIDFTHFEFDGADENIIHTRQTQRWATTREYAILWRETGMNVNPLFVVNAGTGDGDDNTNELCAADGTLKIENIRARC
jgi:hypothetical protein